MLLDRLQCKTLVTSEPVPPVVEFIMGSVSLNKLAIPPIDELLDQHQPLFEYKKTFHEGHSDPLFIM